MKRYISTTLTLCLMLTKRWLRDPVALFFTFLFPLIFLFVFGSLFKGSDVSFEVAVINNSDTQFSQQFEEQLGSSDVFNVSEDVAGLDDARERMGRGELSSIIELPQSFGQTGQQGAPTGTVKVYFEESDPQTGQTVAGVVQQVLYGASEQFADSGSPLNVELASTATENLSQFDYLMAGLMGFTILTLSVFGMANGFPVDKKTGALRRMRATPLKASQVVLATALEYMMIGLLSLALMLVVGMLLFDFQMRGDYITLVLFSIVGIFCLFGFGLAIGGWAKNETQAAPLSNLVALPMMFLSGVFFPIFLMPQWLQTIAGFLPLTPIIDGIRMIITENASLMDLGPELGLVAIWTAVIYTIATKVFRWE